MAEVIQPGHWDIRQTIIKIAANEAGPGSIWLVGDSVTEGLVAPALGAFNTVNMGFGGIRLQSLVSRIAALAPILPAPAKAIVMMSVNNACLPDNDPEQVTFSGDYAGLVNILRAYTTKIALMTTTPFERGFSYDMQMNSLVPQNSFVNAAIAFNASYWGLPLFDLNAAMRGADMTAIPGSTIDGVHPSAAGYNVVRSFYQQAAAI